MIGKTISHYKILEKLGEGGMGVVYKARDTKLDRTVALKFLPKDLTYDDEARTRFIHEAKAASALDHPNIATVYEIDEAEDRTFISMAYVDGKSLKEVASEGPLPIEKALDLAIQIAEGLKEAHGEEIVHRDIKSDNIMVTAKGVARIMDFGLAKLRGASRVTQFGSTVGTLSYMSPEQVRGEEADSRSDIFSFGVVLYEMITGRLPFTGDHEAALMYSILNVSPVPVGEIRTGVPAELAAVVAKAMQKDKGARYQTMVEVLGDLRGLKEKLHTARLAEGVAAGRAKRSGSRLLAPLLAMLVVAIGLLVGIRIQIGRQPSAQASENKLAVMYFDNMADPADEGRLGEMITNLLIADLSESRYVQVVSSQRLFDILKLLGKEGSKTIDRETATQVALRANAKWMLLGNILQIEPRLTIMGQLVDVESGDAVASQRIAAEEGEELFSLIDRLTVEIKDDLSLPSAAQKEEDPQVAEVTTRSQDAYRHYLTGVDHYNKFDQLKAEESFENALECDSTFAMAYYYLCLVPRPDAGECLEKAVTYSEKATEKERHYIAALDAASHGRYEEAAAEYTAIIERYPDEKRAHRELGALYSEALGEADKAIEHYNVVLEMDPIEKLTYNQLAYAYNKLGDLGNAISAINKYISLAPDEPNPYDSRGEIYARHGMMKEAIESFEKALEIKPDFIFSKFSLIYMYIFNGQYDEARDICQELATNSDGRLRRGGRGSLYLIPFHRGRFNDAIRSLDDCLSANKLEGAGEQHSVWIYYPKAFIRNEQGERESTLENVAKAGELFSRWYPDNPLRGRNMFARILAENGKVAEAEALVDSLRIDIEAEHPSLMEAYWSSKGFIELAKGNPEDAIGHFKRAEKELVDPNFGVSYGLGRAYLETGRLGEAVEQLEGALKRYDDARIQMASWSVKAHYFLGQAYERSGWNKKAVAQYETFLDIWKDADPGIAEIGDARHRLEQLRAKT